MRTFKNGKEVNLMIWPVDPKMQKTGCQIKFLADEDLTIKPGDGIETGLDSGGRQKIWLIKEIQETRKAALKGYNYITATATITRK